MQLEKSVTNGRRRTHSIRVWLDDEEYQTMNLLVASTCLNRSEVIRSLISGLTVKEKPPIEYGDIVVQLRKIGNNLNQIAALFHAHGFPNMPELKDGLLNLRRMNDLFVQTFSQEK